MQRITFSPFSSVAVLCLALALPVGLAVTLDGKATSFLEQVYQPTKNGDVVRADLDEFTDWLYESNGDNYRSEDEYRVYKVSQDPAQTYDIVLDSDDYDNPALKGFQSFIDVSTEQNPLSRDTDELPDTPNERGRDHRTGHTSWLLVTTFIEGQASTGKLWAVPRSNRDDAYILVGGLETPTGVCFDPNHEFVYVCDPGKSVIYQYDVEWDGRHKFVLASEMVATIASGVQAQDCSVDAFGNLYFSDSSDNSINIVGYLDLWAGYVGESRKIYGEGNSEGRISTPVGIDVWNSERIFFVNNIGGNDAGLLNSAPTEARRGNIEIDVREDRRAWGVAVSEKYAYYSNSDGSVMITQIWLYRLTGNANLFLKSSDFLSDPRGLCYGQGRVYVADFGLGEVFYFSDSREEEEDPEGFVRLEGAYGIECVNG